MPGDQRDERSEPAVAVQLDQSAAIHPPACPSSQAERCWRSRSILVALNLRPAVTSVAPLLGDMRDELGTSATWAGLLTTMPGLCFAAAGLTAPRLSSRFGLGRVISAALVVLTAGLVLRTVDGPHVVIGATLLACAGIALINVLIPVVIKGSFPTRVGLMTGIYTAALQGGGALVRPSPPASRSRSAAGGWPWRHGRRSRVLALLAWLPASRRHRSSWAVSTELTGEPRSLLRNRLAWTVTLFFGCQAFLAYIVMGWLPQIFIDNGIGKVQAGILVGLVSLIGVPVALIISPLAARTANQSGWIVALGVLGFAGAVGLLVAPAAAPWVWSVLIGVGMSAFSIALTVIALRARNAEDTAQLSGHGTGIRLPVRRHSGRSCSDCCTTSPTAGPSRS